jgi:predicted DNA-binding protein
MITLRLDAQLEQEITSLAKQMGVSKSALVRDSIQQFIAQRKPASAWELGQDVFGKHGSGQGNLARDRKQLLKLKIAAKRQKS